MRIQIGTDIATLTGEFEDPWICETNKFLEAQLNDMFDRDKESPGLPHISEQAVEYFGGFLLDDIESRDGDIIY